MMVNIWTEDIVFPGANALQSNFYGSNTIWANKTIRDRGSSS